MAQQIDFTQLSLAEIEKIQADAAKAADAARAKTRLEAFSVAETALTSRGFSVAEFVQHHAGTGKKSRGKVAPKYAHPENPAVTWTGRGRKPQWVADHIEKGGTVEELAI